MMGTEAADTDKAELELAYTKSGDDGSDWDDDRLH